MLLYLLKKNSLSKKGYPWMFWTRVKKWSDFQKGGNGAGTAWSELWERLNLHLLLECSGSPMLTEFTWSHFVSLTGKKKLCNLYFQQTVTHATPLAVSFMQDQEGWEHLLLNLTSFSVSHHQCMVDFLSTQQSLSEKFLLYCPKGDGSCRT